MDHPVLDREGPWTEDAYLTLIRDTPSRRGRVELVDGTLLVGPGATAERTRACAAVRTIVEAALPEGLRVLGPLPLRLGPDCLLVPDLVVTRVVPDVADARTPDARTPDARTPDARTPDARTPGSRMPDGEPDAGPTAGAVEVLDAADALMVVEVVGHDHGATNRIFKSQLYARSRIPYSLLLDHDEPFAVADMIISGRYHEYARAGGGATLRLEDPFLLQIDLAQVCGVVSAAGT